MIIHSCQGANETADSSQNDVRARAHSLCERRDEARRHRERSSPLVDERN